LRTSLINISFILILCIQNVNSQSGLQYFSRSKGNQLDTLSIEKNAELSGASEGLLYEPIDIEKYIVGPGDEFIISILTSNTDPVQFKQTVSPEGKLMIPGVGSVLVKGLILKDAYELASDKIKSVYRSGQIDIVLVGVRQFKVTVSGNVVTQSVVPAYATERAYEVIQKAGGPLSLASIRNIEIYRDEETIRVDLPKYLYSGDEDSNPYLMGGDQIYVPLADKDNLIEIDGEVKNPGSYEFIEGDKVDDLLAFSKGLTSIADSSKVELYRYNEASDNVEKMILDLSGLESSFLDIDLKSGDRIYVRESSGYYEGDYVVITGEVYRPGRYQISDGMTVLEDLLEKSGGFKSDASIENSKFFRRKNVSFYDPEMARLSEIQPAEMNDMERQYFYSRINEVYGALSINFTELGEEKQLELIDMDSVHVPGKNLYVNVQGRVKKPGLVKFVDGKDYIYYINEAGGYSSDADPDVVMISKDDGSSKYYATDDDYRIEKGDNILVPPEEPIDTERLVTNIVAISAQVLAIISIALTLNN
jgi:protein involved in polysaccharide export with SLBB domain